MPLIIRKSKFAGKNHTRNNSHSINKFAAKAVQMSDNKECEHSEQINPIKPINDIKSNNPPKYRKLSAKTQIPKYKNNLQKNHSLFAQIRFTFHSTLNNPIKMLYANIQQDVNLLKKMPKTKATRSKSTPTKARVTFSDTTPSTPATNTSPNTDTPSRSLIDAAEDICFTETLNKIFSKKLLAILTGKDAILKEVRDCVIRNEQTTRDKPLHLLTLAGSQCKARMCLPRRKNSDTKSIKGCGVGRYTLNSSWESRNVLNSAEYLVAIYQPGYTATASECKACMEIGKNLKSVIPHCKWAPLSKCVEPNDEIQKEFGEPILNDKGLQQYFIKSVDRYSKYPTAEIIINASGTNVINF